MIFDPSAEGVFGAKVSLAGNPANEKALTPVEWALGESRFRNSFEKVDKDTDGVSPSEFLFEGEEDEPVLVECPVTGDILKVDKSILQGAKKCLQVWDVYRELAGLENPYIERIRESLKSEIEAEQNQKVEEMKQGYEGQIAELKKEFDAKMNAQLRNRLLTLAGFNPSSR